MIRSPLERHLARRHHQLNYRKQESTQSQNSAAASFTTLQRRVLLLESIAISNM
jgi:hypothetical protein